MKKTVYLLLISLFLSSLSACAGKEPSLMNPEIRCPACGYSFNTPSDG